jgi:DnaJ-class molecular chaperone
VSAVVVIVAIVAVVAWRVDVQRHPIRRCPSCNGSKKNGGSSEQRWGTCRRCGGTGEVRRPGAGNAGK